MFASENLIAMNNVRNGIIRIKRKERAWHVKIFHMDRCHQLFHDFDFGGADGDNKFFLDVSQVANNSVQSNY